MGQPQRFLFDISFDQPDPPPAAARKVVAEPTFGRADLEAAREAGFAAGHAAAEAEAELQAERRAAAALEALATGVAALIDARAGIAADVEGQALRFLRAVMQKAVPALCRVNPLAEVEALVSACMSEALDEPRLVLRVADSVFDGIQPRLAALATASGYSGKVVLLADAGLGESDARVEWADGGVERDTKRFLADLDAAFARGLAATPPVPTPTEETRHE